MERSGAIAATEALQSLGVTHVFGNPGTTELPFVSAIVESDIEYVTCLHEDVAVGAAAGFATRTRQRTNTTNEPLPLGVANVHTTPGVAHALGNLYGAHFARAPVLITAGCQAPRHERRHPPLSGDRLSLVESSVKDSLKITAAAELPGAFVQAARTALSPPMGPVYLEFPLETQQSTTSATIPELGGLPRLGTPSIDHIEETADRLTPGAVTIVVGSDLAQAGPAAHSAATQLAERLDAPVFGEPLYGELGFPPDHEHWIGMLPPSAEAITARLQRDQVLFLGCRSPQPFLDYDPPVWPGDSSAIWIGIDPAGVPAETSLESVLLGDLDSILEEVIGRIPRPVVTNGGTAMESIRTTHRDDVTSPSAGEDPAELEGKLQLVETLAELANDAVVVEEGVTTGFLLRDVANIPPGRFIAQSSGGLGYGYPAAIGAAIAEQTHGSTPRPVLALIGDGSYQYYPQAAYTIAQHVDTTLTIVVPDNAGYGILRDREYAPENNRERPYTFDERVDITQNAESYGIDAERCAIPGSAETTIRETLTTPDPAVVVVDLPSDRTNPIDQSP